MLSMTSQIEVHCERQGRVARVGDGFEPLRHEPLFVCAEGLPGLPQLYLLVKYLSCLGMDYAVGQTWTLRIDSFWSPEFMATRICICDSTNKS